MLGGVACAAILTFNLFAYRKTSVSISFKKLRRFAYFGIGLIAFLLVACGERNTAPGATTTPTSIVITPSSATITKGQTTNLSAIATYPDGKTADATHSVTWTSSSSGTASVNSATGVVTGVAAGSATMIATLNGITSSAANIGVSPANLVSVSVAPVAASIVLGGTTTLTATGLYSDNTTGDISKLVTWKSSNTNVLKISRLGITTGVGVGSSSVSAILHEIESNVTTMTVAYSVGGTLTGLAAGNRITLSNNKVDKLTLTANGSFSFPTGMANGSAFNLAIAKLPTGQPCTQTYGAGRIHSANAIGLTVICGLPPRGDMVKTTSLVVARRDHTATLLPNGKILMAGGVGATDNLASAELFDPVAERWNLTGSLTMARRNHTATLLPNSKVLVVGGLDKAFARLSSAELYDAASGRWSAAGNLAMARSQHTATLLPNGKVLVTGGVGMAGVGTLSSAELYDPTTMRWTATGNLATARSLHTATLLPNGKVLVTGGVGAANAGTLASAELYDPGTERWTATGSPATARSQHTATLLPKGQVLVTGGIGTTASLASAELYDPATGRWAATGSLTAMRFLHTAILLPTGKVLVTGGVDATNNLASTELYDPESKRWTATGNLNTARSQHAATLLSNGKLLVTGGNGTGVLADAELYW
jgi:N-acetylneuraminic acid mutarotase